jgi:hypothetical protein
MARATADGVLLVGNQSSTYFNSLAGAVTLANCLVAGVSLKNRNSLEAMNRVNQVVTKWEYLLV